jgi:hypothetical protein
MGLLAQPAEDFEVSLAVIREAQRLDGERRRAEAKALVEGIGSAVAGKVATLLRAMR